jgi:hypothetical protein
VDFPSADPAAPPPGHARWLQDAKRVDVTLYAAIAQTPTPTLDRAMARLSHAADYSRLSLASAAVLAATGGRRGQRAAAMGLASVAVTASLVNLGVKPLGRRRRPDRAVEQVPIARHVRMPTSTSFPPATPLPRSPSQPGSATCSRRRRSRCAGSPHSSPTRESTPGSTSPATSSPAR